MAAAATSDDTGSTYLAILSDTVFSLEKEFWKRNSELEYVKRIKSYDHARIHETASNAIEAQCNYFALKVVINDATERPSNGEMVTALKHAYSTLLMDRKSVVAGECTLLDVFNGACESLRGIVATRKAEYEHEKKGEASDSIHEAMIAHMEASRNHRVMVIATCDHLGNAQLMKLRDEELQILVKMHDDLQTQKRLWNIIHRSVWEAWKFEQDYVDTLPPRRQMLIGRRYNFQPHLYRDATGNFIL